MLLSLNERYLDLPPVPAWPSVAGVVFKLSRMTDLDGDGRAELPVFVPGQLTRHLGVLAYYDAADVSASWASAGSKPEIVGATLYDGEPHSWTPSPNDFVLSGNITCNRQQSQTEDLLVLNEGRLFVLRWESVNTADQIAIKRLHTVSHCDGFIPGSGTSPFWNLTDTTRFALADFDGDGQDELFCYDGAGTVGLARWRADGLVMKRTFSGEVRSKQTYDVYQIRAPFKIHAADINADGVAELIAYTETGLVVLSWNEAEPTLLGEVFSSIEPGNSKAGVWQLLNGDVLRFADIDGDGQVELLLSSDNYLSLARWEGSRFVMLGGNSFTVNGPAGTWSLQPGQFTRTAKLLSSNAHNVVAFQGTRLGVLFWSAADAAFATSFSDEVIPSPTIATGWHLPADLQMAFGDVDGDGRDEIVMQSNRDCAVALVRLGEEGLQADSLFVAKQPAKERLPTWGLGLVASAPATTFTPYTGTAVEIYAQISTSLTLGATPDIRSEYDNPGATLAAWAGSLASASPTSTEWKWMAQYSSPASQAILNEVVQEVLVELLAADSLYRMNNSVQDLAGKIQKQRIQDLNTVVANLARVDPQATTLPYWAGALIEVALVSLAAFPFGEGFALLNVGLAGVSSLFGSLLGAVAASNPEQQIDVATLQQNIQQEATTAQNASNAQLSLLLADPVKLRMLQRLLLTDWAWKPETDGLIAQGSSSVSRLGFYQQLLPELYNLWVWQQSIDPDPQCWTENGATGGWIDFSPPDYCTWRRFQEMQYTQIQILAPLGVSPGSGSYPPPQLIDDLFGTADGQLGIPLQPVLDGISTVLPIPHTTQTVYGTPKLGIIYATNSSNEVITAKVYTWGGGIHLTDATLSPGQTATMQQAVILWGSKYDIKAEPGDSSIELYLNTSYAVNYAGGSWSIIN